MKKVTSFLLVLSVMLGALMGFSISVSADAPAVWDGSVAAAFAGGDGTEEAPYQISNGAELALLAAKLADEDQAANYYNLYYVLTADIVLNEGDSATWGKPDPADETIIVAPANSYTAIGIWKTKTSSFGGHFNGQGHTISGLYISSSNDGQGLFGCIQGGAVIENFALVNSYVSCTGGGATGAIIGQTDRSSEADITVSNIYVEATVVCGGYDEVGGVIGNLSNSKADGSFTSGRVTVDRVTFVGSVKAKSYVAGIIGNARNVGVDITNCLVYASIQGSGSYVAGIMAKSKSDEGKTPTGEDIPTVAYCVVAGTEIISKNSDESKQYNRAYVSQNSKTEAYKTAVNNCYDAVGITDTRNTTDADNEDIAPVQLYGSYDGTGVIDWSTWANANWASKTDDIVRPKGIAENFEINPQQNVQTEFTVKWMNGDEVLATETYSVGETPTYKGSEPTKAEEEHYTYTFNRWTPEIKAVTEDAVYTAEFYRTRKTSDTTSEKPEDTTASPVTTAPATTTAVPETTAAKQEEKKKGCGSVIGSSAALIALLIGAGAVAVRKKED